MARANNFDFNRFRNAMQNPAHGNQFRIDIFAPLELRTGIPDYNNQEASLPFKVKAGNIPALTTDEVEMSFGGRKLKIPGDRTLESWTVQVYMTHGLPERKFFEGWADQMLGVECADRAPDAESNVFADANLFQTNRNAETGASYTFTDIWPSSIGETSFDSENSEVLMLDVTFAINGIVTSGIRNSTA